MLTDAYSYFVGASEGASSILQQNIMMNAFKAGITNYASSTGNATAMLQNISSEIALSKMRTSWAISRALAQHILPLMQTVLLLLMIGCFPLIIILTLQPGIGVSIFKNFMFTLLWLESWPPLFAILNYAATFYLHVNGQGQTTGGLTLSNLHPILQEHSDIQGIAGYLMLSIPFISIGLVKGMASTFNQAAQYLGGMAHSVAQGSASEAVTGNYSLGNTSFDNTTAHNLSENKHDSNFTSYQGLVTNQLENGATVTQTPSGNAIYNTTGAMSQLATSVHAGEMMSSSLSHQADHYQSLANAHRESYDTAMSSAFNNLSAYDSSIQSGTSLSSTYGDHQTAAFDHAVSNMWSDAKSYAESHGMSTQDAFRNLTQITAGISASGEFSFLGAKIGGSINNSAQGQSTIDNSSTNSATRSSDHKLAQDFRENLQTAMQYSKSHNLSESSGASSSLAARLTEDLRQASTESDQFAADYSTGERLNQAANWSLQNSASVQENFAQGFAAYVQQREPERADTLLANTQSEAIAMQRDHLAMAYVNQRASSIAKQIESNPSFSPEKDFSQSAAALKSSAQGGIAVSDELSKGYINMQGNQVDFNAKEAKSFENKVNNNLQGINSNITASSHSKQENFTHMKEQVNNEIQYAQQKNSEGLIAHGFGFRDMKENLKDKVKDEL